MAIIDEKYQKLVKNLKSLGSILVGFSGGVDSSFLLYAGIDALGKENVLAVTAVSPSLADRERNEARAIAIKLKANHLEITTEEMGIPEYRANTELRCMHCKNELYSKLREKADELGYDHVVDATNADEAGGHRPGLKAIDKLEIKTPLKEAGLSKYEIRQLSKKFDLPTWNKPSMACLASRIPYGSEVNEEKLKRIGSAEEYLLNLGVRQVRVRDHYPVARIEVEPEDMPMLLSEENRAEVDKKLKSFGYKYVAIDIAGFHSGSMNLMLEDNEEK